MHQGCFWSSGDSERGRSFLGFKNSSCLSSSEKNTSSNRQKSAISDASIDAFCLGIQRYEVPMESLASDAWFNFATGANLQWSEESDHPEYGTRTSSKRERGKFVLIFNVTAIVQMFDSLMSGVEVNLSVKNKDNFTQNVSRFRQELCSVLKTGAGLGGDLSHSSSDNFMSW